MALSLGVKRGKRILVGGRELVVRSVLAANSVLVSFEGREILVTDMQREELMPGVFVSCGLSLKAADNQYSRLAFEAPRSVRIERVPDRAA